MKKLPLAAVTIFLGSFILFALQPMLGRTILPQFGGSATVWVVCLATYQLLLLAGYGYAHFMAKQRAPRQRYLHVALLILGTIWAGLFTLLRTTAHTLPTIGHAPALQVLAVVALTIGIPYVILSAGSSLVQAWLASASHTPAPLVDHTSLPDPELKTQDPAPPASATSTTSPITSNLSPSTSDVPPTGGRSLYRLYAISNLGSLSGLLIYPLLIEPLFPLSLQWHCFTTAMVLYTALVAALATATMRGGDAASEPHSLLPHSLTALQSHSLEATALPSPLSRPWLWFALPALTTFLLNAVTAHLSTDVTPVPLMWVLLLAAFLLSYIVGFSTIGGRCLPLWTSLAIISLVIAAGYAFKVYGHSFLPSLTICTIVVFFGGTALHSWLYRIRPSYDRLTLFYLGGAAGGALGGISASLLAPLIFNRVIEYPLALTLTAAACGWLLYCLRHPLLRGWPEWLLLALSLTTLGLALNGTLKERKETLLRQRNFYGCLRVSAGELRSPLGDKLATRHFHHGATLHGYQAVDFYLRDRPTTYYGPSGGGIALFNHPAYTNGAPMRVGLIGLGVGTMACYGRTNDLYRFFEINPQVTAIARDTRWFTYLSDSPATIEVVPGDARHALTAEAAADAALYDVLVIDAYSGDSIPFHLATREAFDLYLSRLAPDGILALHISNWHIDLFPLCKAMAAAAGLHATGSVSSQVGLCTTATWVFMSRTPHTYNLYGARAINWANVQDIPPLTDERGSLTPLIRFNQTPPVKQETIDFSQIWQN